MPKVGEEVKARWSDKRLYLAKIMKISSEGKLLGDALAQQGVRTLQLQ